MAKRVSVIDIGSNSIRMVIYEKTSRFAFHLLHESKSKVRLSENAYKNDGNLQEIPMQRTFEAIKDFISISKSYHSKKLLCVATSALRDAPNKQEFIAKVRRELKLNIKVIDGKREAYLGTMACANLLPKQEVALCIDIGGGSTEFGLIDNGNVSSTLSFQLGTVRLKELYFDTNSIHEAIEYIDKQLQELPKVENFTLIGIGGTFRAIASAIMNRKNYPFEKLHAYESSKSDFLEYIDILLKSDESQLQQLGIKKNRNDIIKPGALVLQRLLINSSIKNIITSGVGVREGVYLSDLLRNSNDKFPHNYNNSVRYLLDLNVINTNYSNNLAKLSSKIFDLTHSHLGIDAKYKKEFVIASKLYPIGSSVHFFSTNTQSYYLIKNALEHGFTHNETMLIATLTRFAKKKLPSQEHVAKYAFLLPDQNTLNALSYLISLSIALLSHKPRNIDFQLSLQNNELHIISNESLYLCKEAISKLEGLENLTITFATP